MKLSWQKQYREQIFYPLSWFNGFFFNSIERFKIKSILCIMRQIFLESYFNIFKKHCPYTPLRACNHLEQTVVQIMLWHVSGPGGIINCGEFLPNITSVISVFIFIMYNLPRVLNHIPSSLKKISLYFSLKMKPILCIKLSGSFIQTFISIFLRILYKKRCVKSLLKD